MTMPHLMNCQHQDSGWCLDCVKELRDKYERLAEEIETVLSFSYSYCTGENRLSGSPNDFWVVSYEQLQEALEKNK